MSMSDTLVSFKTAKLAKEKGFNILTHSYYFEDGEFKENSLTGTNGYYGEDYEFNLEEFYENWNDKWLTKKSGDRCFGCSKSRGYFETFSAPTQSLLQKWLREMHKIEVFVHLRTLAIGWVVKVRNMENYAKLHQNVSSSYEKAFERGLYEALKII